MVSYYSLSFSVLRAFFCDDDDDDDEAKERSERKFSSLCFFEFFTTREPTKEESEREREREESESERV